MNISKLYQTYLKDCDCEGGGIILYEGKAVCRWCRKPYAKGSSMSYSDEHFKQSKQPPTTQDWSILSVLADDGKPIYLPSLDIIDTTLKNKGERIHSVRRISDGEVFQIGDKVQHHFSKREIVIDNFNIHAEHIYANSKGEYGEFLLRSLIRPTPSPKEEDKAVRPSLGVMPKWLWDETRLKELNEAIERYKEAGKEIPQEWIDEQYTLSKKIKSTTEEDKRIEVELEFLTDGFDGRGVYWIETTKQIHPDKFPAIKSAIERVLNEDTVVEHGIKDEFDGERMYRKSEVDAMIKEAWIEARKLETGNDITGYMGTGLKHNTIGDYIPRLSEPLPSTVEEKKEAIPVTIDENAYKNRCNVCGDNLVYIRGKYPNTDKRPTCPTCTTERLEQINEISNKDYGKAYQSNS